VGANSTTPPHRNVAMTIREMILREYAPGQRLPTERALSAELGVSRAAVREALRELASLNITMSKQGSGTFVRELNVDGLFAPLTFALTVDPSMLLHLYELRRTLEPVGALLAAARGTAQQVEAISHRFTRYEVEYMAGNWVDLITHDEEIHRLIGDASGNPLLSAVLRSLSEAAHRVRLVTAPLASTPPASYQELRACVEAILDRDPLRAEAAMTRHISRLEADARSTLESEWRHATPTMENEPVQDLAGRLPADRS